MNEVADQVHLAVDYGSSSGVLAAFGIVYGVAAVLGLIVYVWYALALSKLFPRLGAEGWKGWVPILNEATILQLGGKPAWNVVFYFIPIVQIYGLILKIQATHKINERYGRGAGSTVLAVLLPPVWASILAWGVAPYPEGDRLAALQPGPRRQAPPADAEHHGAGQGYLAPPILPHAGAGAGASTPFAPAAPFAPSAPFDSAAPGAGAPAQAAPTHGDPLFGTPMFTAPASDPGVPASPADDLFANPAAPPAPAYAPVAPPTFAPLLPDPPGGFVPAPPAAPEAPAASESSSGGAALGFGSAPAAAPAPEPWVPASADAAAPVSPAPAAWDPAPASSAPAPTSWDSAAPAAPASPAPASWGQAPAPAPADPAPASWEPATPAASPSWDSAAPAAPGSGSVAPAAPAQPTWTPEPLPGPGKEESVLWTPGPIESVQTGTIVVPDAGHGAPAGVPPVPLPPVFAAAPPAADTAPPAFAPAAQASAPQESAPQPPAADARDAVPSWPVADHSPAPGSDLIVDVPGAARTASAPAVDEPAAPATLAATAAESDRAADRQSVAPAPAAQSPSADEPVLQTLRRAPIRVSLEPETASTDAADTLAGAEPSPAQPSVDVEYHGRDAVPAAPQPGPASAASTERVPQADAPPQRSSAPETAPTPIWDQFVGRAYEAAVAESVTHTPHDDEPQTPEQASAPQPGYAPEPTPATSPAPEQSAPQPIARETPAPEPATAPAAAPAPVPTFEWPTPPAFTETPAAEAPAAEGLMDERSAADSPAASSPAAEVLQDTPSHTLAPAPAPVPAPAPAPVLEPPLRGPDLGSRNDLSAGIRPAPIPVTLPEPPVAEPEPEAADDDFEATVVVPRRRGVRRVLVLDDGRSFALSASSVVIGRNPAGEAGEQRLAISDGTRTLSKTHARLIVQGDEWRLTDLHSTNGVVVVADDGAETLLDPGESVIGAGRFILGEVGMHVEVESDS